MEWLSYANGVVSESDRGIENPSASYMGGGFGAVQNRIAHDMPTGVKKYAPESV